jgi:DNA-binding transcriptional LysR family regulator
MVYLRMLRDPAPIELRHLRYFLAVVDELHFGRAADRLHMAQPPLSRAIRKLEDTLGVKLLVRSSRSVAATEAGRVFAEEARKVLAAVDQAVAEGRRAGGATTSLRIAYVPYLPADQLQEFLAALHDCDESIATEVTHMYTLEQVRRLRAGEIDVGVYADAGEQPDVSTEPLFRGESVTLFVAESHRLSGRDAIGPQDVRGETLIAFPRALNPGYFDRWMALLDENGFLFDGVQESTSLNPRDVMLHAARGGAVALAPESFAHQGAADVVGVVSCPLERPLTMPDTRIAWMTSAGNGVAPSLAVAREVAREIYRRSAPLPAA